MDPDLYDEFGNYIGPELESDDEEDSEEEQREEEEKEFDEGMEQEEEEVEKSCLEKTVIIAIREILESECIYFD